MITPAVKEIERLLEPVTQDTFVVGSRGAASPKRLPLERAGTYLAGTPRSGGSDTARLSFAALAGRTTR